MLRCGSMNRDERAFTRVMKMQIEQVSLEILRDVEILSDREGRYIFHLARIYASA